MIKVVNGGVLISIEITEAWMKGQIQISNKNAAQNRNKYPIQEQATQTELWEYVSCRCDENCTCKKFGCTRHWKLKKELQFESFLYGFLRTFVDRSEHLNILMAMEQKQPLKLNIRQKELLSILVELRDTWDSKSTQSANHIKTLFCDDWADDFFTQCWKKFKIKKSVYLAKQYCILLPDICVPYDINSRKKILQDFNIDENVDYFEFLKRVRQKILRDMEKQNLQIPRMRTFDSPNSYLPFNQRLISLRRCDRNYGTEYLPKERPISLIIDKCFYKP